MSHVSGTYRPFQVMPGWNLVLIVLSTIPSILRSVVDGILLGRHMFRRI